MKEEAWRRQPDVPCGSRLVDPGSLSRTVSWPAAGHGAKAGMDRSTAVPGGGQSVSGAGAIPVTGTGWPCRGDWPGSGFAGLRAAPNADGHQNLAARSDRTLAVCSLVGG